jgi:hypothetical protein
MHPDDLIQIRGRSKGYRFDVIERGEMLLVLQRRLGYGRPEGTPCRCSSSGVRCGEACGGVWRQRRIRVVVVRANHDEPGSK